MFHGLMIHNSRNISKKGSFLSANAHHDITDFQFHGMLRNLKKNLNVSRMAHDLH